VKIAQTKIRCTHVSQTSLGEELIFAQPKIKKEKNKSKKKKKHFKTF
jgi:hypothetical protein